MTLSQNIYLGGSEEATMCLKARLGDFCDDSIYTDLTGRLDRGGIFVSTYNPIPINTVVSLEIHFPDGFRARTHGVVEWVKEYNPMVPDMVPGAGVRLFDLGGEVLNKLRHHANEHQTLFFDNRPLNHSVARCETLLEPSQDNSAKRAFEIPAAASTAGVSDDRGVDLEAECAAAREEITFFSGLVRDVEAYLDGERRRHEPHPLPRDMPSPHRPGVSQQAKTTALSTSGLKTKMNSRGIQFDPGLETLVANVIPWGRIERQFHGGFSSNPNPRRAFIASENPRLIGARVNVFLRFPRGWELKGVGVVNWVRKFNPRVGYAAAPPGMGVSIERIISGSWETASQFLTSRDGYIMGEEVTF